ncbi:diguanylate cyclase [Bradyrhizobium oligotrophicum S58]|uniref:diguanylate cyclase n=1 Tax=Bradyrhizobium oligotrophicum S58 TaxID=1245469 RepID=M4ZYJ5_9BRAD|nr:sensor domain-containing diguanylate cyclase [Bradyrhizobium oligotrophicum]BAM91520.1 diguanylate cyclase [Bradyrhizobium oligotrophicum S58]
MFQTLKDRIRAVENRLSVRMQIAAATAAISLMLIGALAASAAFVSYHNTAALLNGNLTNLATNAAGRLDRFMAVRQQEMSLLSQLRPLQKVWHGEPGEVRNVLEQLQRTFSEFAWIGFADVDGKVIASTGGLLQGQSVAARPWFKNGLQRMAVGDVHEAILLASLLTQRATDEPYRFVDLSMPVFDADGKLLGVLGGHLNWDWASALIKDIEDNDGGADTRLAIIGKDGTVLVGAQRDTVKYSGEQLAGILKNRDGTFIETAGDEKMLTAFHVGTGHREYQGLNWIVTASQPASVALAAAMRSAEIILGIGAAVALIGVSLALLMARRIAAPIRAVTQEADRIGRLSGPSMLARQGGSAEVVQLTRALRSLLRRIGLAEERTKEAELRATENALQFQDDLTRLQRLADQDFLTGLMNRRAFVAAADDAMQYCRRYQRGLGTLMIDIDHFKKINDTHGHAVGDQAIKAVADIINGSIRTTDKAARFGGEEFVVLLREIDEPTAMLLAERIRRNIEVATIENGASCVPATVSIGLSLLEENDRDIQDMIERADQGLYAAKTTGRNRVVLMAPSPTSLARAA